MSDTFSCREHTMRESSRGRSKNSHGTKDQDSTREQIHFNGQSGNEVEREHKSGIFDTSYDQNGGTKMSCDSFLLPPDGWLYESLSSYEASSYFMGDTVSDFGSLPALTGFRERFLRKEHHSSVNSSIATGNFSSRQGWQKPGPGPRRKTMKSGTAANIESMCMIALLSTLREALSFEQANILETTEQNTSYPIFVSRIDMLANIEEDIMVSKSIGKNIWIPTNHLGVPSFLLKLGSPDHALSLHLVPGRNDILWWCSYCNHIELQSSPACSHSSVLTECIGRVAKSLNSEPINIIATMKRFAAFSHGQSLEPISFYRDGTKRSLAVMRNGNGNLSFPLQSLETVVILKSMRKSKGWKCLAHSCKGISATCNHSQLAREAANSGDASCNMNLFALQKEEQGDWNNNPDQESSVSSHPRPLIPSRRAFRVDEKANLCSFSGSSMKIGPSPFCHCGCSLETEAGSRVWSTKLRVESYRSHVTYEQLIWICKRGHFVLPEEHEPFRDGLVWISRNTAYTEVFLFDTLLQLSFCGSTISGQANIRSQLMLLRSQYVTEASSPRSNPCFRKALLKYAASVTMNIPSWVFRCRNCSTSTEEGVFYDKISFDGQQVGFNTRNDTRHEFFRRRQTAWTRPVERCPKAWQFSHIIESNHLRNIVTESLRGREVPVGCNSVQALCRCVMKVTLNSSETIRAAVAAIKIFDPEWNCRPEFPNSTVDDSSLERYLATSDSEMEVHPMQFICPDTTLLDDFTCAKSIIHVYQDVIDCKKAANILVVLLTNLREDLQATIPVRDRICLQMYNSEAYHHLQQWLETMSNTSLWKNRAQSDIEESLAEETTEEMAVFSNLLRHPIRSPLSWVSIENGQNSRSLAEEKIMCMVSGVRSVGSFECPPEAVIRINQLIMAILNEPVIVWLRTGSMKTIDCALESLRIAFRYCGSQGSNQEHRDCLEDVLGCTLLYEGIMGILGANVPQARGIITTIHGAINSVKLKYNKYACAMDSFVANRAGSISPTEYDNMLKATGALQNNGLSDEGENEQASEDVRMKIKNQISQIAATHNESFIDSGVSNSKLGS